MTAFNNTSDSMKEIRSSSKNLDVYKYVLAIKNMCDKKLFPDNFDVWTVEEQYTWINENLATFFPTVPQTLLRYIPSFYQQPNFDRSPTEIPEWLDMEKYSRGQKLVRDYYLSVIFAKILGIIYVYSFVDDLKPIIQNRQADTPYLGFERYLSTILRILDWYNGQPWVKGTAACKNMEYAHRMHSLMRKKLCELDDEQIDNASKVAKPWCPDRELLLKDFALACPFEKSGQRPHIMLENLPMHKPKGLHSTSIAMTQCSFISTILLTPQKLGIHNATDEDLEAFCHMWRYYGYSLGLDDEQNFCHGSFEEVKERVQDYYRYWVIPNLKEITPEWEHMTRCLVEPLNYYPFIYMPYKVMMLLATDALNLDMPNLYASLSYAEWIAHKGWK
ncbi:hypothetical protein X777_02665 [Ooceraea biroi]|uniref:Uncharacterized protein n=2 Tax=Ooceraea biroi TaxID=2015173 RepID=A0A026WNX6_OOCBI|nr:hypothetical protein X777_02665 [Ooceraea biroi]